MTNRRIAKKKLKRAFAEGLRCPECVERHHTVKVSKDTFQRLRALQKALWHSCLHQTIDFLFEPLLSMTDEELEAWAKGIERKQLRRDAAQVYMEWEMEGERVATEAVERLPK